ncbi:RNA polymerase sigma factor [Macrococcus carouselicus]|uniref:Sigma-70 family RNA polymerase sigma factor n=1 Tax=Macrococcus carouselicus TaxID=69969 RepID=A0A9Q8CGS7_9STAP|nr:sigma-70 family RNA polymerase sigma factor [Macrococcus carouselicus]TDM00889.1 sigma-70 family RNA polymerase sigma factor [Macrococcus carouselicus]
MNILLSYIFELSADYYTESDELLVSKVKTGNDSAFECLSVRMKPLIYHYGLRYPSLEIQEIHQDALILLYHSALQFDEEKCGKFQPYYLKMLHYRLVDWARKDRQYRYTMSLQQPLHQEVSDQSLEEILSDCKPTPENISIYKELWLSINPVTLGLSPFENQLLKHLIAGDGLLEVMEKEKKTERMVRNAYTRLKNKILSQLMR